MALDERNQGGGGFRPEDEIDEVFGRANPNPDRSVCPPKEMLSELARRGRPLGDPAYKHLTKCSPCYREFRKLQEEGHRFGLSFRIAAVAAAALVLVVGLLYFALRRLPAPVPMSKESGDTTMERAVLDLRAYGVTRGQETPENPILRLPRKNLQITIFLPVGSEPGEYDLQILDDELNSKLSKTLVADLKNYVATMEATLDLRPMQIGWYRIAIRAHGGDWQLHHARIQ